MTRRIAITGASGRVGRMLVPRLAGAGAGLVLAGRDPERLAVLFPDHDAVGYDDLEPALSGCDALLHLAAMNNDVPGSLEAFRSVNVDFLISTAEMAARTGVPLFINVTTVHALDPAADTPYAVTKREGEAALAEVGALTAVALRLPSVYGETFAGKLSVLNRLPKALRRPALAIASAFRPAVSADRVADAIIALLDGMSERDIIVTDPPDENAVFAGLKRAIDLGFVAAVMVLLWWLLALVWLGVRLSSSGSAFFAQPRVGQYGRVFRCYKFRTMRPDTPQLATHEVAQEYITPLGRFLRWSKIDELPQIWNIARGEMSLVGPRPCLPAQETLIDRRRRLDVFRCRPGITGLAQVDGVDMSEPEKLARLDARYCKLRSVALDLKVILRTLWLH